MDKFISEIQRRINADMQNILYDLLKQFKHIEFKCVQPNAKYVVQALYAYVNRPRAAVDPTIEFLANGDVSISWVSKPVKSKHRSSISLVFYKAFVIKKFLFWTFKIPTVDRIGLTGVGKAYDGVIENLTMEDALHKVYKILQHQDFQKEDEQWF